MDAIASRYRALFEHAMDGVLLTAPDGRILMANPAAENMLGYSEAEIRALGRRGLVDASDARLAAALEERRRTGRFRGELRLVRKDGTRLEAEVSTAVFRDEQGEELTSLFLRDVSGRRDAEEAVRASERLLNGIFEVLPVGVWIADAQGRIVRANPAGLRIWGGTRYVGPDEFHEYRAWWAETGEPIQPEDWALSRALKKGEASIGELIRIQCFDGTQKTVINSALPLHDEEGRFAGAIAVNLDVTELREVEEKLRRAVDSRERVLGIVAHDLRSPLQVIRLHLARLQRGGVERRREARRRLQSVEHQVARMDRLIEDLLDVMRIEAGELRLERAPVSPYALLQEAAQTARPLATAAGIEVLIDLERHMPAVRADRARVVQVLDNLVGNALKFTPRGGRIALCAARRGGEALFSVSDTGSGLEPQALARLFEQGWECRRDPRGLGLGLAIVKGIVEAHGGRVWAESTPAHGATFHFTLPLEG